MTIHVVGGVYRELCVHPHWDELYGSAGRAAVALAAMDRDVVLHSYFTEKTADWFRGAFELYSKLSLQPTSVSRNLGFRYVHDSANPEITPNPLPLEPSIVVKAEHVVRFGMLEGDAIVEAECAVYDPQNPRAAIAFSANGSSARRLALVLNLAEARVLAGDLNLGAVDCARVLGERDGVEVVVIKQGPLGALVWEKGKGFDVPAYRTSSVWKIGSGDCFVAHFAAAWMEGEMCAVDAADCASRATAFYCQYRSLPSLSQLTGFAPEAVTVSADYRNGAQRSVYLAGPFFDIAQIWMVDEALRNLTDFGFKVFSPFHHVGFGTAREVVHVDIEALEAADVVFALADGVDAGTIFEVGYARARGIPVVIYSERESDATLLMAEGTSCVICRNYTTALYTVLWEAARI